MNRNHRIVILTILGAVLALAALTGAGRLLADVLATNYAPERVNYQGYLTDSGGNPISSTVTLQFSIWDASSGGNQVWSETHNNVPVSSGYFSVLLGSQGTPLATSIFKGSPRYLEVVYGATTFPRQVFGSVPYALVANYATEAITATYALSGPGGVDWENVVIVAKSGGDYTTVTDALASITPTVTSRYLLLVMPGVYTETVTLPSYVHLKGSGTLVTRITSDANGNVNLGVSSTMTVPANSQVSDLTIVNTSTTNDGVAVRISNGNDNSRLHNIRVHAEGAGGDRHMAFYLSGGSASLTHIHGEAGGGTIFNRGLFNSASDPLIEDSTLQATGNDPDGLHLNGGNVVIRESVIRATNGTNTGQGIGSSAGGANVRIDRSNILGDPGTGSSIASNNLNDDFLVGATLLQGDVDVFANSTIKCAQSYNGNYTELLPSCAPVP